jgi:hypothetical protein
VGHPATVFVDPIDGTGWEAVIGSFLAQGPRRLAPVPGYASLSWADYFAALSPFMRKLTKSRAT